MTETIQTPQATGQLIDIGTVAAANIAKALGVEEKHVGTIKQAIRDEINAMSSHFTLAVSDVQTQYEAELNRIRSTFSYVAANKVLVGVTLAVVFVLGVVVGHFA